MATIGVKVQLDGGQTYKQQMSAITQQTKMYQAEVKNLTNNISKGNSVYRNHIAQGRALENQLASQREQEKLLADEIDKATAKYGENSKQVQSLQTQMYNLQTAISNTESAIKANGGIGGAMTAQLQQISQQLGEVGKKMSEFGDTITKSITGPIVAVGTASVAAFKDVDTAMDNIIKKTGATGEALEEMQKSAQNIATTIPTSFDTAANAIGEVNTRFGVTGQQLEDLSTRFVQFSNINGTDVVTSIDTVQKALAAYGLSAEDAAAYLDRVNKVGQDTGISVDKLSQGIVSNATAFQEMGLNVDEALVFMGQLEKSGSNSETVLNGMRKALKAAAKEGKPLDQALAELQDTIVNGTSDMDGLTAAYDLFGKSGDQIYGAVKNGTINFKELGSSMADASGSVSNTFTATIDPIEQMQVELNKLKLVGSEIGSSIMPMITQALEKLSEVVSKISEAWNGLTEEQQQTIVKVALVVAAIGPVISVVGRAITVISGLVSAIAGIPALIGTIVTFITATAIPAITGVIAAIAPFLPIIAAVGLAIAGVILVVQNWGAITDWLSQKWTEFTTWLNTTITALSEWWSTIWTTISTVVNTIWTNIKTAISNVLTSIATGVKTKIDSIKTTITTKLDAIKSTFTGLKDKALTWGKDMIQGFIDGIKAKWETLKQTVSDIAQSIKDFLGFSCPDKGPLSDAYKYGPDFMELYADGIKNAQYLVKNAVEDVALDMAATMSSPLTSDDIYEAIRSGASNATTSIILNNREVTRALTGLGVQFDG